MRNCQIIRAGEPARFLKSIGISVGWRCSCDGRVRSVSERKAQLVDRIGFYSWTVVNHFTTRTIIDVAAITRRCGRTGPTDWDDCGRSSAIAGRGSVEP